MLSLMGKNKRTTSARELLLEAAIGLIMERGYPNAAVDDVCAAAGVSKGSFYHHFSSKESLGVAVIDSWVEHFGSRIRENLSEFSVPVDNIHGILDGIAAAQEEAGYLGCPLGRLALEMGDVSERLRQRLQEGFDGLRSLFADYLEQGGMAPEEASEVGHYMLATLEGSLMLDKVRGDTQKAFHAGTAVDGNEVVTSGGRVLCVVGLGDSVASAASTAYEAVDEIQWDDVYLRRDIGHRAIARERNSG